MAVNSVFEKEFFVENWSKNKSICQNNCDFSLSIVSSSFAHVKNIFTITIFTVSSYGEIPGYKCVNYTTH